MLMNTRGCNITSLALKELSKITWGTGCVDIDTDDILRNYGNSLNCPEVDIPICNPAPCVNDTKHLVCSLIVQSIGYVLADNNADITFYVILTNGTLPYRFIWTYNTAHFNLKSGSVNDNDLKLTIKPGIDFKVLVTQVTVSVTDTDDCYATQSCWLDKMFMHCGAYTACANPYGLIITVL